MSVHQQIGWDRMNLEGGRVLVVDDAYTNREFLSIVLRDLKIDVVTCEDGQEAVDLLQVDRDFDIVFMDMQMPVLDGLSATKVLRSRNVEIPIVALTANIMASDEKRCMEAGCSHYLSKPIDVSRLLPLTAELIRQSARTLLSNCKKPNPEKPGLPMERQPVQPQPTHALISKSSNGSTPQKAPMESIDELFAELGIELVEKVVERIPELEKALASKSVKPFLECGHWLKGSAGTIGMNELAACGVGLEKAAASNDFDKTELALNDLRKLLADTDCG